MYYYNLLDSDGNVVETRCSEQPLLIGEGAPGEQANMVEVEGPSEADEQSALLKSEAKVELNKSDMVCIRCYKAAGAYPAEWLARDEELRAIIRGTSTATEIPAQPDFPEGT